MVADAVEASGSSYVCPLGCLSCSKWNGCVNCHRNFSFHLEKVFMRKIGVCLKKCPPGYVKWAFHQTPSYNRCIGTILLLHLSCCNNRHCTCCHKYCYYYWMHLRKYPTTQSLADAVNYINNLFDTMDRFIALQIRNCSDKSLVHFFFIGAVAGAVSYMLRQLLKIMCTIFCWEYFVCCMSRRIYFVKHTLEKD